MGHVAKWGIVMPAWTVSLFSNHFYCCVLPLE